MAGHVHRDRQGRSPAPAMSHRPVGKKRVHHAVSDRSPKRSEALEVPRLRALEAQAAAIPISSSAASSTSPRSGSSRVNPYPVGEAIESSPFELVPSVATQATQSWEQEGSLESTPIHDDICPITPSNKPTHDRYRTPSAIGRAIGRPYLALSRFYAQAGVLNRLFLNRLKGSTAR